MTKTVSDLKKEYPIDLSSGQTESLRGVNNPRKDIKELRAEFPHLLAEGGVHRGQDGLGGIFLIVAQGKGLGSLQFILRHSDLNSFVIFCAYSIRYFGKNFKCFFGL